MLSLTDAHKLKARCPSCNKDMLLQNCSSGISHFGDNTSCELSFQCNCGVSLNLNFPSGLPSKYLHNEPIKIDIEGEIEWE